MPNLINAIVQSNLIVETISDSLKYEFTILTTVITLSFATITAMAAYFGWNNKKATTEAIEDSKKKIANLLDEAINKQIKDSINPKIQDIEKIVKQEAVIREVKVKYCLPFANRKIENLEEFRLLENRGFYIKAEKSYSIQSKLEDCDVFVLDFVNGEYQDNEDDKNKILDIINKAANSIPKKSAFIFYVKVHLSHAKLNSIFQDIDVYYTPANNVLTLMGRVIDAAQINKAFEGLER